MTDAQPPDLRVGDVERSDALRALDEHLSVGRLDIDEYGERSARITLARTRRQLTDVFVDLPQPHPTFDRQLYTPPPAPVVAPGPLPATSTGPVPSIRREASVTPRSQRLGNALVPLALIVATALFVLVPGVTWVIFLIPAAFAVIAGSLRGDHEGRNRNRNRDR